MIIRGIIFIYFILLQWTRLSPFTLITKTLLPLSAYWKTQWKLAGVTWIKTVIISSFRLAPLNQDDCLPIIPVRPPQPLLEQKPLD